MKKSVKILLIALCYVFLCVFMFSGYKIYTIVSEYNEADSKYNDIRDQFVTTATPAPTVKPADPKATEDPNTTPEPEKPKYDPNVSPLSVDFKALHESNDDVKAWIYNPETIINYPVAQSDDNDYYLYRALDHSSNSSGTMFIDYRCAADFSSNHTLIYGHNMKNGSMLSTITNYWKQEYYEQHPFMYINTPTQNYRVDLFSGYVTPADSDAYNIYFKDGADYLKFLQKLESRSNFTSDVELTENDRIVTLSTCTYEYEGARYVVHGKLVPIS